MTDNKPRRQGPGATWSEFNKWTETADLADMFDEALLDDNQGQEICQNILLRKDEVGAGRVIIARTHMLKGKIDRKMRTSSALRNLKEGLELADKLVAEGLIDAEDAMIVETRELVEIMCPRDPESAGEYFRKVCEYLEKHGFNDGAWSSNVSAGWALVWYAFSFHIEVEWDGLDGYYANKGGKHQTSTESAYRKLKNKRLTAAVTNCFALYRKNEAKHVASRESREPHLKEHDIVPAGDAPGRYEGDSEDYDDAQWEFLSAAGDLDELLTKYIKRNPKEFQPLPC